MRDRTAFAAVFAIALGLSAVLLWPRLSAVTPPHVDAAPSASAPPEAPPLPSGPTVEPAATAAPPPRPKPPSYVRENPESLAACGEGMLLIDSVYCPFVGHRCTEFLDEDHDVCASYAPEVICEGALSHRRYCIDRYEYPNIEGVYPVVMVDFNDAARACEVEGKRLCAMAEWELACEGPAMWPYPYGLERDSTACNIDRPHPEPDLPAFSDPQRISIEVARLDQRVRSGEMPRCVSPFGVHDMTGNVDEWAENPEGGRLEPPYRSALKGGYWGPVRDRCRPKTASHNEWFRFYQVGFRCCSDTSDGGSAVTAAPEQRRPRRQRLEGPAR